MISYQELNRKGHKLPDRVEANLQRLLVKINQVRALYGKPMIVTSGVRTQEEQAVINPKAPHSRHIDGEAVDIADPKGELKDWIKNHVPDMETIGFWFEDFSATPTWVHFQIVPPKSGSRFFLP